MKVCDLCGIEGAGVEKGLVTAVDGLVNGEDEITKVEGDGVHFGPNISHGGGGVLLDVLNGFEEEEDV